MAVTYDDVLRSAQQLTPEDITRLQHDLSQLAQERTGAAEQAQDNPSSVLDRVLTEIEQRPLRSLYGALADLGPAPSAEDIDEMRREAWANFPADDI